MKKISCFFLFLLVLSVYAQKKKLPVISKAEELKTVKSKQIIWQKDRAKMAVVRPYQPVSYKEEKTFNRLGEPITKKVKVDEVLPLWFDVTEVTVGQFKMFLAQSNHPFSGDLWKKVYENSPDNNYPMINVNWHDATAYAKWAGKRLPTEEEWEFAARGGLIDKEYSWGNDESLAGDYANHDGIDDKDKWDDTTAPVGSLKPNGYVLYDVAGNVWEWCQDWYDNDKVWKVLRGGGWGSDSNHLRLAIRDNHHPDCRYRNYGFRCVLGSN